MAFLKQWKNEWKLQSLSFDELFKVIVDVVIKQLDELEEDEGAEELEGAEEGQRNVGTASALRLGADARRLAHGRLRHERRPAVAREHLEEEQARAAEGRNVRVVLQHGARHDVGEELRAAGGCARPAVARIDQKSRAGSSALGRRRLSPSEAPTARRCAEPGSVPFGALRRPDNLAACQVHLERDCVRHSCRNCGRLEDSHGVLAEEHIASGSSSSAESKQTSSEDSHDAQEAAWRMGEALCEMLRDVLQQRPGSTSS